MSSADFVFALLGFIFGIIVSYLTLRSKRRAEVAAEQHARAAMESARMALEKEVQRIPALEKEIFRLNDFVRNLEGDRGRLSERADRLPGLEEIIENQRNMLEAGQWSQADLGARIKGLETELKNEKENFVKLQDARKELVLQFESVSKNVLASSNTSFLTLAEQKLGQFQEAAKGDLAKRQQSIDELITPLRTKITDFENKVNEVYRTEAAERNTLRGEIKNLVELNQQISKEANNLAQALKGNTKKQGNWGELILEKVLELSGLRKGDVYKLQAQFVSEEGKVRYPDAVVYLPENKHIIIDSKVSLVAYERYVSCETDEERATALAHHIASVKRHIQELSDKSYFTLPGLDSPDFTLLFIPIESSFGLAVQADSALFNYAWDRKIVIVSPTTLLATLWTIASIWKRAYQSKNAFDIADRAGKMYDKFCGFIDDLLVVGKKMDEAKKGYEGVMNKISTGSGNLVSQSEQLKKMGAKASKALPQAMLDRAVEPMLPIPALPQNIASGPDEDGRLLF